MSAQQVFNISTGLSATEWASWIQAVGSLGAVVGIWWQVRKQRQFAERLARQQLVSAFEEARDLLMHSYTMVAELKASCQSGRRYVDHIGSLTVEGQHQELAILMKEFDVKRLHPAAAKIAFRVGAAAHADAVTTTEHASRNINRGIPADAVASADGERFQRLLSTLLDQAQTIRDEQDSAIKPS